MPQTPRDFQEKKEQFVKKPFELIHCGKFLSASARVVFDVLASFHPSYPGYRKIQNSTGFGSECVSNALDELESKKIIERKSGWAKRKNNRYRIRPQCEWDLLQKVLTPSEKRKLSTSIIEAGMPKNYFDNRRTPTSIIEDGATSIIEEELDQSKLDQLNYSDASRQKVSSGLDHNGKNYEKGIALSGDAIKRSRTADLEAEIERRKKENTVGKGARSTNYAQA